MDTVKIEGKKTEPNKDKFHNKIAKAFQIKQLDIVFYDGQEDGYYIISTI